MGAIAHVISSAVPTPASMRGLAIPTASVSASDLSILESKHGDDDASHRKTMTLIGTCSSMLIMSLCFRVVFLWLKQQQRRRQMICGIRVRTFLHMLDVGVYLVLWYGISIGMTLFNKWFLRIWEGGYPFATTMTCINMITKCAISRIINYCSSSKMTALPPRVYWRIAVPIGICAALDITLSNISLFYITVTFYTIIKSGGNVWNLLFSVCLGHQRASMALCVVVLLISTGIGMASYGSTQFVFHGFVLVMIASIIGTFRWVLTQTLLKEMDQSSNRILGVVYYISPASALGLLPLAIATEGSAMMESKFITDYQLFLQSFCFIMAGGVLAFVLMAVEVMLVKKTSALSLGIAGSFKDVTQVMLAVLVFQDQLTMINASGLIVATIGMLLYTHIKHRAADSSKKSHTYVRVPRHDKSQVQEDTQNFQETYDGIPVIITSSALPDKVELVRRESKDIVEDKEVAASMISSAPSRAH